jgi:hypothetical protein
MANSSIILSTLDFDSLKANLKQYLQSQSTFKDYNFEGSNMSVLLDVMSYNTFLNAFYLNMVASEMFLDSAQKYDSVISHAKELNYIPNSAKSSSPEITLNVVASNTGGVLTVPKGTRFSGTNSNGSFIFTTDESTTVISNTSGNNNFTLSNLRIYEGNYFTDTYVMNYNIENQQFLLSNRNADTSSMSVTVIENAGASNTTFKQVKNLFGLNSNSNVYFLQAAQEGLYEIVFGENLFGKKPLNGAIITMNYRVTAGISADGVSKFSLVSDLGPTNGGTIDSSSVTTVSNSSGGSSQESIESVRFAAPRYFATQQRAVTSDDYSSLILSNFGEQISDVLVYGGQEAEPKKYGRVIVAVKPSSGTIAPNFVKENISNYLRDLVALPNRVEIEDPDYLYCSVVSKVQYDENVTTKTASEIKTSILNNIISYSKNNLEKFDNDLRYSKVVSVIDNTDPSVVSNQTDLRLVKRLTPTLNLSEKFSIKTFNHIFYTSAIYTPNAEHTALHSDSYSLHSEHTSIISSTFTYNSTDGKSYPLSFIEEDQKGNLKIFSPVGNELIVTDTVGTVNYATGDISITRLNAAEYNNYISLYIRTETSDLIAKQNKILIIDPSDVNVEMLGKLE